MKNICQTFTILIIIFGLYSCAQMPRANCNRLDPDCDFFGTVVAQKSEIQTSLSGKDAAFLSLDFSSSNVVIWTSNPTINIILKENGTIIDTISTNLNYYNYVFTFSNPGVINSFLLLNDGLYDEISYDLNGIKYSQQSGANNVIGEIKYDNSIVTGSSWSYYNSPNQNCSVANCQQF